MTNLARQEEPDYFPKLEPFQFVLMFVCYAILSHKRYIPTNDPKHSKWRDVNEALLHFREVLLEKAAGVRTKHVPSADHILKIAQLLEPKQGVPVKFWYTFESVKVSYDGVMRLATDLSRWEIKDDEMWARNILADPRGEWTPFLRSNLAPIIDVL